MDYNSKTSNNKWNKQMKDELMVQQQVENVWQHMVGVICLNQTGRKKVKKIFDQRVKRVESYARKHPDKLDYVMKRYPKNDPRLSMLNYKMDRMTEANDKYLETQFPTNQALFTKVKDRTKKNMNLTDPKNFKPVKDPIKYVDVKKTKKLKETVTRHFNKPVKSKSMFGLSISKVKKTNQKMVEKREQEQRMKEEENAYIQERMSRQKSNWKDDLTDL